MMTSMNLRNFRVMDEKLQGVSQRNNGKAVACSILNYPLHYRGSARVWQTTEKKFFTTVYNHGEYVLWETDCNGRTLPSSCVLSRCFVNEGEVLSKTHADFMREQGYIILDY